MRQGGHPVGAGPLGSTGLRAQAAVVNKRWRYPSVFRTQNGKEFRVYLPTAKTRESQLPKQEERFPLTAALVGSSACFAAWLRSSEARKHGNPNAYHFP